MKSTTKSSRTSNRVVSSYRGFDIVKVTVSNFHRDWYGFYHSDWIDSETVWYNFCENGKGKLTSQHYIASASSIKQCKEFIDKHISGESVFLTSKEKNDWVYKPNEKQGYGWGNYELLMGLMKKYQKADHRRREGYLLMLEDANFHSELCFLQDEDWAGFENFVSEQWPCETIKTLTIKTGGVKLEDNVIEDIKQVIEKYVEQRCKIANVSVTLTEP